MGLISGAALLWLVLSAGHLLRARAEVESDFPTWARELATGAIAELAQATTDRERYFVLGRAALANLEFGHLDLARSQAVELDRLRMSRDRDWNHGNAIEDVNVVLGRLALRAGDVPEARRCLLAAGRSPGSPQMDTFGPNMSLARDLLRVGERKVVLEYFELCRRFWEMHRGRLDEWAAVVRRGEDPQFGANRFLRVHSTAVLDRRPTRAQSMPAPELAGRPMAPCAAGADPAMLDRATLEVADRWWARDFWCHANELRPAATRVQEHAGALVGSTGIWILAVGPWPLVSLPKAAIDALAIRARSWSSALVADHAALSAEIRPLGIEKIVGPAYIGYGTSETLDLSLGAGARALTRADDAGVAGLRAACSHEEWEHGGSDPHAVPTFGCVGDGGEVLALAGYKVWGDTIAHISIACAPRARGRGFASAAVACAARHALAAGLVPQYRTLASNGPSMGVARRVGFQPYGFSVFVRLQS